ncbi:MAG: histidinol-phosphate aminotransferase family protein [Gemmatimonadaceae bacterium]|nr:histidinol-phosphate aminotransferase family protein [Gemmatimonadaceae bacterium]
MTILTKNGSAIADLSYNTNFWGPPPDVRAFLSELPANILSEYPAAQGASLRSAISNHVSFEPASIAVGCGSDELIDAAFRAFARPGARVAYPDPTFPTVEQFARSSRLITIPTPLAPDYSPDIRALARADADVVYVCSPNNPTGGVIDRADLERLLMITRGIVILDEAYIEFADRSNIDLVESSDRLLVLRTFSKAFGLAGVRVGYAVGSPALIASLDAVRAPYSVNAIAQQTALTALECGLPWVEVCVSHTRALRARFLSELASAGICALPSQANFVLVTGVDVRAAAKELQAVRVRARMFENLTGIGDAIRIAMAPWPIMDRCLTALRRATQK